MKFLTNLYDPNLPDAKRLIICRINQTLEEAWEEQKYWLKDKIIGLPQETETYNVFQLIGMGMVGVYSK